MELRKLQDMVLQPQQHQSSEESIPKAATTQKAEDQSFEEIVTLLMEEVGPIFHSLQYLGASIPMGAPLLGDSLSHADHSISIFETDALLSGVCLGGLSGYETHGLHGGKSAALEERS